MPLMVRKVGANASLLVWNEKVGCDTKKKKRSYGPYREIFCFCSTKRENNTDSQVHFTLTDYYQFH